MQTARWIAKALRRASLLALGLSLQGCFWLLPTTQPTELHFATTPDQWKLALHRYKPEQVAVEKEPLLLVHGIASNHLSFDLVKERSLAIYLFEKGYDVWMLDLRGAGDSSQPSLLPFGEHKPDYNFDTYVEIDAPTAIEFVRYETRREQISWIGHSLGAMLGYAYMGLHPGERSIRSFVALSGPASFELRSKVMGFALQFKGIAEILPKVYARPLAQLMANNVGWLDNSFSPTKGVLAPQSLAEALLWNSQTLDARTMSMISYNVVSNLSRPLFQQLIGWVESGEFRSADGAIPYADNLDRIKVPTLVLTGKVDALCPPLAARKVFEKLGTLDKSLRIIGTANGYSGDYGHMGVVLGDKARQDVFPLVFSWLEQH